MPEWMKQYVPFIHNTGGNDVERMVNGNANPQINLPLSTLQACVKSQVGMLTDLYIKNLLLPVPPAEEEGLPGGIYDEKGRIILRGPQEITRLITDCLFATYGDDGGALTIAEQKRRGAFVRDIIIALEREILSHGGPDES